MNLIDLSAAILISAAFAYLVTPAMGFIAGGLGIVDRPSKRKVHLRNTPLLGGLAIYFGFIISLTLTAICDRMLLGMLVGGTVMMVIGLADDKFGMLPRVKLLGQFVAALIAVLLGVRVAFLKITWASMAFTCVWLVAITNAFNLLDNINGLCAGVSAIAAFFFGILAYINGDMLIAVTALALMGGCLGFLKHNFPNAKIFMGDAGSLFLGYVLGSIAVAGSWKTSSVTTSLAIPILILGYPIFDITLVTLTRLMEGRPVSAGGKDHSSHRFAIAIMESVRGARIKRGKGISRRKFFRLAVVEFMKGLKKKGHDRSLDRLAALGFRNKRAVIFLYAMGFALGLAALAMTVLGRYFDWTIMIFAFVLLCLFGLRLAIVPIAADKKKRKG